jgi:diguanylate cyclase (GGDEF)-like protein
VSDGQQHGDGARRAQALARLRVLEELPPASLQRVTRLAAHIAGGAGVSAAVHLLDGDHQHRVAAAQAPRERSDAVTSLCVHVVDDDRSLYLEEPARDPRFADNPWTTGPGALRMYYGVPLRTRDGQPFGTLCVFSPDPITLDDEQRALLGDLAEEASSQLELVELTRQLGHDAAHDPLTGLANRVVLSHRLQSALARRERRQGEPVLLIVDLDGFKGVNDTHGHGVGDEVLRSTAARLQSAVRAGDLVTRLGGDEFAVLLESVTSASDVDEVVGRLAALAVVPHDTSAGPVRCGFTTGVGCAEPGDLSYEVLGRADADLYRHKVPTQR